MKTLYQDGAVKIAWISSEAAVDDLTQMFELVARELGWEPGDRISAYRRRSVHLTAVVDGELAGGLQLAGPDASGTLPYREVWPDLPLDDHISVGHVTVLSLRKEFRGREGVFWPLCVELWRHCVSKGIDDIRLEATPNTLRLYRRIGWPLEIAGDLRTHWGEPCFLCRASVSDFSASIAEKAERSLKYRMIVEQAHREPESESSV